ncbi:MAG TPA: signal peptide peptidase SppA [Rhodanobacteraceae bacterium]|nr:signal peptide peptidase SppA [Rhodanobacteraceae bacterium]
MERKRNGFLGFLWTILRGINLVRVVILNIVFFGLLALILVVLGRERPALQDATVLVLQPQGQLVEQYSVSPVSRALARLSGDETRQVQVRDLVAAIDRAADDSRISRILLLPGDLQAGGFAALRQVGDALQRFRASGKPVTAWAAGMDQDQYYLAARADQVLLDPQGGVIATGLSSYRLFYKDLLDKLGVQVHLFRVGQYKSAAEPYILDHASDAAKAADSAWLGGLWDQWIADVAGWRKLDPAALRTHLDDLPAELQAAGGDLGKLSLQLHLADGLATREQLIAMLRKDGVPAGRDGRQFRQVDVHDYLAMTEPGPALAPQPAVAVVVAEGEIVGGSQAAGKIGGDSTSALIRKARLDRHIKALVLRVDSPGGEVYAAEQIRREVALTRKAGKPVMVSMGDVAASGGYWIAMDADRIYAEPNTITGSIGIFGLMFNVPDTLAKVGVHNDGVGVGPLAGAFDVTRPLDPKVGAMMQSIIDKGYRDFVGGVAKARGQSFAAIDAIAQGHVWTGRQALQRGLVDQLGGLGDAIRAAAKQAGLHDGYPVRYLERPLSGFDRFMLGVSQGASARALASVGIRLPAWLGAVAKAAPELSLLQHAKPGRPQVYAYCFCAPR